MCGPTTETSPGSAGVKREGTQPLDGDRSGPHKSGSVEWQVVPTTLLSDARMPTGDYRHKTDARRYTGDEVLMTSISLTQGVTI
jgi:hypothetical protein